MFVNVSASRGLHQDEEKKEISVNKAIAQYIKYRMDKSLLSLDSEHPANE